MEKALRDAFLQPVWEGGSMECETVMIMGEAGEAALLYRPDRIEGVFDYGRTCRFTEGKDYTIAGNRIVRIPGGALPFAEPDVLYASKPAQFPIAVLPDVCPDANEDRKWFTYGEGDTYTRHMIAVSYTHSDSWKGRIPAGSGGRFAELFAAAGQKGRLDMVVYGDSISTGCNASGTPMGGNVPPYLPTFGELVADVLEERFGFEVSLHNAAVGGWTTQNGCDAFEERVQKAPHDLMLLGFGMNDGDSPPEDYRRRIGDMCVRFREKNPEAKIVLIGTMLPNIESNWILGQERLVGELYTLRAQLDFTAVADMTAIHRDLLLAGKRYRDMTGNNVNHPNDFLVRVYAQVILKTLLG